MLGKKKPERRHLAANPRYAALELLIKVDKQKAYSNLLVNDVIAGHHLSGKDAGLFTEIVYGTLSRQLTLDFYLEPFLQKAKKVDSWVRQLLRLSVYQMVYLDRVPDYSILHDAVEIAKQKGNAGIGKFVNGVLRSVQRQGVPSFDTIADNHERLSVELSLPVWLVAYFTELLGEETTRSMGLSLLVPSSASARVDTTRLTVSEALSQLEDEGIICQKSSLSPVGIIAEKGHLAGSRLFAAGALTIQDESSMLVAPAMQLEPHHQVLDACAAPGGKTTHIATYLDAAQGGLVTALDIHEHKVALIEENARRLHVADRVRALRLDARHAAEQFADASFDRILVDAPCSGLGLLRRKPDLRYNKKPEDFMNLQRIQLEILDSVSTKVKLWGIITYSTCTMTREENDEVVSKFIETHPNFDVITVDAGAAAAGSLDGKLLKIYPHHYHSDGFFISCLRRKA